MSLQLFDIVFPFIFFHSKFLGMCVSSSSPFFLSFFSFFLLLFSLLFSSSSSPFYSFPIAFFQVLSNLSFILAFSPFLSRFNDSRFVPSFLSFVISSSFSSSMLYPIIPSPSFQNSFFLSIDLCSSLTPYSLHHHLSPFTHLSYRSFASFPNVLTLCSFFLLYLLISPFPSSLPLSFLLFESVII